MITGRPRRQPPRRQHRRDHAASARSRSATSIVRTLRTSSSTRRRRSLRGWTGSVNLNRNSGVHGVNAALWAVSPGFDSSDAGFNFDERSRRDARGLSVAQPEGQPRSSAAGSSRSPSFTRGTSRASCRADGVYHVRQRASSRTTGRCSPTLGYFRRRAGRPGDARRAVDARQPPRAMAFVGVESDGRKRRLGRASTATTSSNECGRLEPELRASTALSSRRVARDFEPVRASSAPTTLAQYVDTFVDPVAADDLRLAIRVRDAATRRSSACRRASTTCSRRRCRCRSTCSRWCRSATTSGSRSSPGPRTFDFIRYGIDRGALTYDPAGAAVHREPGRRRRDVQLRRSGLQFQVAAAERDLPMGMAAWIRAVPRVDRTAAGRARIPGSSRSAAISAAPSARRPTTC